MTRLLLRLISVLVPHAVRPRWREEWMAEMNHARSRGRSLRDRLRMAAGSIPDALATRRVAKTGRTPEPRASIFHAMDQDVRYAMRGLAKSPGFALGVVLSLAVGIGANAAAFSFIDAAVFRPFPGVRDQHELFLDYVGRRRADVTIEQVTAEAGVFRARLDTTRSDSQSRVMVTRVWLNDPANNVPSVVGFMVLPMLVLAIACVNAANLVLARSSRRVRDWTVRLALGATRWRVVRQVLAESMMLSVAAAGLGLLLARWALSFIASQIPFPMPLDHRVALFTIVIAVLTAVTFSLGPALGVTSRATRKLTPASSGQGGSGRSRARFALVLIQAALSLGLLATGAQFTKTVKAAATQEYIPDPERLVLTSFDLDPLGLRREAGEDFYRRLLDRVSVIPGVTAAGLSTNGLVAGVFSRDSSARIWLPDSPPEGQPQMAFCVSPRLLDAIGVPLFQGRRFTPADETALRTVVVNKPFVAKFLQGQALGQTFRFGATRGALSGGTDVTVVGVVDGMMKRGDQEPPIVYYAAPLGYQQARSLYIRLDRTGTFNAAALHAAAREVDARVPMAEVSTLADISISKDTELKTLTRAAALLGLLALVLSAGGLYSVVAYVVSLRRQEVGIRLALGADAGSIVSMVVRQALTPTLIGAFIGAGGAAAAGALIRSRMYGATPVDPLAFGAATVLMLMVMLMASWIPARHAARVDPVQVLRQE